MSSDELMMEKRQSIRTVLRTSLVMTIRDGNRISGESVDIGEGGCCGRFVRQMQLGEKVHLTTTLPTLHAPLRVEFDAVVAWCILSQGSYKIGFKFVLIGESQKSAIRRLCTM